jgi:hypothetical protein
MIDADEDGAGSLVSPPHHDDRNAFRLAAAEIRPDPDLTLDPHARNYSRSLKAQRLSW